MKTRNVKGKQVPITNHELNNPGKVVRALWKAFIQMGKAGANVDVKHPQRDAWELARKVLIEEGYL